MKVENNLLTISDSKELLNLMSENNLSSEEYEDIIYAQDEKIKLLERNQKNLEDVIENLNKNFSLNEGETPVDSKLNEVNTFLENSLKAKSFNEDLSRRSATLLKKEMAHYKNDYDVLKRENEMLIKQIEQISALKMNITENQINKVLDRIDSSNKIFLEQKAIFSQINNSLHSNFINFNNNLDNHFNNLDNHFNNLDNHFNNLDNHFNNWDNRFNNFENYFNRMGVSDSSWSSGKSLRESNEIMNNFFYNQIHSSFKDKLMSIFPSFFILLKFRHFGLKNALKTIKGYRKIKKESLFDVSFYIRKYSYLSSLSSDVLLNYLLHKENWNKFPNKNFDPVFFRKQHSDMPSNLNPLVYYALYHDGKDWITIG